MSSFLSSCSLFPISMIMSNFHFQNKLMRTCSDLLSISCLASLIALLFSIALLKYILYYIHRIKQTHITVQKKIYTSLIIELKSEILSQLLIILTTLWLNWLIFGWVGWQMLLKLNILSNNVIIMHIRNNRGFLPVLPFQQRTT